MRAAWQNVTRKRDISQNECDEFLSQQWSKCGLRCGCFVCPSWFGRRKVSWASWAGDPWSNTLLPAHNKLFLKLQIFEAIFIFISSNIWNNMYFFPRLSKLRTLPLQKWIPLQNQPSRRGILRVSIAASTLIPCSYSNVMLWEQSSWSFLTRLESLEGDYVCFNVRMTTAVPR